MSTAPTKPTPARKNLRQVRRLLADYFGADAQLELEVYRTRKTYYLTVYYHTFRLLEEVKADLTRLIGEGWDVQAQPFMHYPEYVAGILHLIEQQRLQLVEKLKGKPHFMEGHVNRLCNFDLFNVEQYAKKVLENMQYYNEHPDEVDIWDLEEWRKAV